MTPFSHSSSAIPTGSPSASDLTFLTAAFSDFITASATLETSYQRLQMEVSHLSDELEERNTTLKASLAENQRVHAALEQIVNSMPCGILVVENDGSVSMMNAEAARLLGIQELSGLSLELVSRLSGLDLSNFVKRGDALEDEQEFCKTFNGEKRWLSVHDRSLPGSASNVAAGQQTILILRDVTTGKQVEQDRERMRQAVAISEVATTLAHEIRNPLASLELFAGLIENGGEDTSEWISHLRAGIRSLGGTVNNVLSLRGAGFPAMDTLNLVEVIHNSVEFVRPIADEAEISLTFSAESKNIRVRANANAMQQLVLNVVGNSIRHTKAGGRIEIAVREITQNSHEQGGVAGVEFSDTGSGIAEDQIADIFQLGFSGDGNSSGLGLAVCRQIMLQHAGDLQVTSKVGEGTTFNMEIPTL